LNQASPERERKRERRELAAPVKSRAGVGRERGRGNQTAQGTLLISSKDEKKAKGRERRGAGRVYV